MLKVLYSLVISPIEILVEVVYSIMHGIFDDAGLAIIAVSLVIQTLILPLYKRADALQDEERKRQKDMSYWVDHIKKSFSGDERYMMLSAYYREVGYKQWYAVISSASILLQIPFFIAAYHYLSNLQRLHGQSFLFIKDLSQPDMAITVGAIGINVLPVLMTLINIVSGIIYTKGFSIREKMQVYILALVFLVLLYNSPSGLVLYWTMNNIYSLLKNVFMKMIKLKRIELKATRLQMKARDIRQILPGMYLLGAVFLAVFIGAVIPLNVVKSSAYEFVNLYHGPLYLVGINLATMIGVFVLWGGIFFFFMKDEARLVMAIGSIVLTGCTLLNYLGVTKDLGVMSPLYYYDDGLSFTKNELLINLFFVCAIIVMIVIAFLKWPNVIRRTVQILIISSVCMVLFNSYNVQAQAKQYQIDTAKTRFDKNKQILHFSKNGKNVVVIMLDRAVGGFVPYIFDEKPEIAEMYQGFTFYPNTISFGGTTNYGSPALFGGYEYTPEAMNTRSEQSLEEKHKEALLILPILFSDNGYNVTVCDPPVCYNGLSDFSMYKDYKNVEAYSTVGVYTDDMAGIFAEDYQNKQESLTFYHSIMKSLPLLLQKPFYHYGYYFSKKEVVEMDFMNSYSVLKNMNNMTEVTDDDTDNFLVFQNGSTHENTMLSIPDYEPVAGAENMIEDCIDYYNTIFADDKNAFNLRNYDMISHYQCNVATLRELGNWFMYLRENDCWDNTRIIIVADHGWPLKNFNDMLFTNNNLDVEAFNPILMEKDFNASEFTVSDEFMTNADVPSMAMEDVIKNPINVFTGNAVNSESKSRIQMVTTSRNFSTSENNGNTFDTSDGVWYRVIPGNIRDEANWEKVD